MFLAVRLTEEAMVRAREVQDALRDRIARQGVRFTAPNKIHLTLAFLGDDLDPEQAHEIALATLADCAALELELGEVGAFPQMARPKTVWLGVHGDALAELAGRLSRAFGLEEAPFVGHLTLARVSPASKAVGWLLQSFLKETQPGPQVAWTAHEVELIASLPSGEYQTLQTYNLQYRSENLLRER